MSAIADGRIAASDMVSDGADGDRYSLSLRPGTYTITSPGDPPGQSVTVQAGRQITVNLPDLCS